MAMKKKAVRQRKAASDETVIYKIMIALGIACIAILTLQLVSKYYRTAGSMFAVRTALGGASIVLCAGAAVLLALYLFQRKKASFWRYAGIPLFITVLLLALSSILLYFTWVNYVPFLYFLYIASFLLYTIALLYQHAFFLLSLVNTGAGAVFFCLSRLYDTNSFFSAKALLLNCLLAIFIIAAASAMLAATKHDGRLTIGRKGLLLFSHGESPILLYISCAVWLVCLIAAAVLGAVFAYYCVFAVVAFELIAAVYYTIKLA